MSTAPERPAQRGRPAARGGALVGSLAVALAAAVVAPGLRADAAEQVQSRRAPAGVGVLYSGTDAQTHDCTASVVHSHRHDLVITAAHCVTGTGAGMRFAPGYDHGSAPHGVWTVRAAYADARWRSRQDPQHDVALLRLARQRRGGRTVGVEDVVGAERLASAPKVGRTVTVIGYLVGEDRSISCTDQALRESGSTAFGCEGYNRGTSGGPFRARRHGRTDVVGVIGGPYQGGCTEQVTYTSTFGAAQRTLLRRAERGGAGDTLPEPGGDGCPS